MDRLSLKSIDMDIVVNTGGREFECVKAHYLPIYGLRGAISSERVSIGDNVGFLLLPLWVHSICIGYFDFKRDPNALMLSLDIELNSMVYSALFGNVVRFGVQTWCIWHTGLVFVAKFKPLSIFVATLYIAAFLGFIFLGDS
ncbi:hypothetical protein Gohar_000247, partial [Gossypium harknessii]|nr:hypothetical protein [Gossypium harknessii]